MRFPNVRVGDTVRVLLQADFGDVKAGTVDVVTKVTANGTVQVGTGKHNAFYGRSGGKLELVTTAYPNAPHKHADMIKAWADGAEIEYKCKGMSLYYPVPNPQWLLVTGGKYRIKAQTVKSDKDIQIEKLEQQAIDLAAAISKLKDGA